MEPRLPKLQNLAGHVTECKGAKDAKKLDGPTSKEHVNLKQSVEIMNVFLKEGELDVSTPQRQKKFRKCANAKYFKKNSQRNR
jgi:hypothetical protein